MKRNELTCDEGLPHEEDGDDQRPFKKGSFTTVAASEQSRKPELVTRLLSLPEEQMITLLLMCQPAKVKARYESIVAGEAENSRPNSTGYGPLPIVAKVEKIVNILSDVQVSQLLEKIEEWEHKPSDSKAGYST